jgi:hypothetical protein
MNDRERDLSVLEKFCSKERIPGHGVIALALCTIVSIGLALWSSAHGFPSFILVAQILCMLLIWILMQYCFAGPLFREVQRLKDEIFSLKVQRLKDEIDSPKTE